MTEPLCLVSDPVCEVTILVQKWADVIFTLPIAINIVEKTLFFVVPHIFGSFNSNLAGVSATQIFSLQWQAAPLYSSHTT